MHFRVHAPVRNLIQVNPSWINYMSWEFVLNPQYTARCDNCDRPLARGAGECSVPSGRHLDPCRSGRIQLGQLADDGGLAPLLYVRFGDV